MDLATLVGLIGAFIIVGSAIYIGGSPIIFVNIPSVLIVVLGTGFVVAMKFSLDKMGKAFKVAMNAFFYRSISAEEMISECVRLAAISRKEGPLGLEKEDIKNEFLGRGIRLLVDGTDAEIIRVIMDRERLAVTERHSEGQSIFMAINEVAPAMGMIGTLIGLVQMLANMSDPSAIGPAMAVALLTTLYGAILSNMVAKPISDKLAMRSTEEELLNQLSIDAVYAMSKGHNSMVVQESLVCYLSSKKRDEFQKKLEANRGASAQGEKAS